MIYHALKTTLYLIFPIFSIFKQQSLSHQTYLFSLFCEMYDSDSGADAGNKTQVIIIKRNKTL